MGRCTTMLSLSALCACASTGSTREDAPASPQTMRVGGRAGATIVAEAVPNVTKVPYTVEQVWRALPAVYEALAIPTALLDSKAHVISNQGSKVRQRLGKVPLSRYIECGTTQIGPNAETYDVQLSVVTRVDADPPSGGAKISTTVDAAAKPVAFSQEYSRCSSKGELETRIVELVTEQVKR
jgi:hypothetical protein